MENTPFSLGTGLFGSPTQTTTPAYNNKGGLFGTGWNYSLNTGFTPVPSMGTPAKNPNFNITPPSNVLSPSQKSPLAPGQTTTQGNQASPQPASQPAAPTQPPAPVSTGQQPAWQTSLEASNNAAADAQGANLNSSGLYGQAAYNLANTTPAGGVTQAQTNLNNQATGPNPANQNIANLTDIGLYGSPQVNNAVQNVQGLQQEQNEIATNPNMASEVASGRGQAITGQINAAQTSVQNALAQQSQQINAANEAGGQQLTGQQQQIGAASNAGSIANTAQSNQINAQGQVVGLQYGLPSTSGGGSGNLNPQSYAQSLAQQVINGTMSYQDAQNAMGYAGSAGGAFLQQAITQANPNFNFNQANVNAQTQGSIGPQTSLASQIISQLQSTLSSVPSMQQTGYPAVNAISALWNNAGLGGSSAQQSSQALTDYINEARQSTATALGAAYNTTPSTFDGIVGSWFPANPTQAQIQAGAQAFQSMINARVSSFGSPGNTQAPTSTGSSIYDF